MSNSKHGILSYWKQKRLSLGIWTIRRSLGISEEELAIKVGYKNSAIIKAIEAGKSEPSYDKVKDIANALGVSINQLRLTGKIETNESGWPKITEGERYALYLLGPMIRDMDEEDLRHLIKTADLLLSKKGRVPKWETYEQEGKAKDD